MQIYIRATLPDDLVQEFMQTLRDFDMRHDPQHEGRVHFDNDQRNRLAHG